MGRFSVSVEVGDSAGQLFQSTEALVDTSATCLVVSRGTFVSLGVQSVDRAPAGGQTMEYDIGLVSLRLEGRTLPVLRVFSDEDSRPLLGAVALESSRLAPDPVRQGLTPVLGRR